MWNAALEEDLTALDFLTGLPYSSKTGLFFLEKPSSCFDSQTIDSSSFWRMMLTYHPLFNVFPLPFGLASTYSSHSLAFIVSLSPAS